MNYVITDQSGHIYLTSEAAAHVAPQYFGEGPLAVAQAQAYAEAQGGSAVLVAG